MENFIKSPLSYPGNKFEILNQIFSFIKEGEIIFDIFCGSSVVGVNSFSKKILLNDKNENIFNLLKYLIKTPLNKIKNEIEDIIKIYDLTNSLENGYKFYKSKIRGKKTNNGLKELNKKGFEELRRKFNWLKEKKSRKAIVMLLVLKIYGFNGDIRFNSNGEFNIPVGKTDFNLATFNRIEKFKLKTKNKEVILSNLDFRDKKIEPKIEIADIIYIDPPYLLTDAFYNKMWNAHMEDDLYDFIEKKIIASNKKFILSNILKRGEKENTILMKFIKKNGLIIKNVEKNYISSSYNKKNRYILDEEVLVMNFELQ